MSTWIDIAALEDVPLRGARVVKTGFGCIAVFRTGANSVHALNNTCPHKSGPLAEGIVHGKSVTCPLHNWVISLETGEAQGQDEGRVATYPARVEAGRILLDRSVLQARVAA
ncbi:nitrite reductase small subunit NirD [Roseobacter sp.]|uniref:nitrite reductase small subunit NirD n=1 Tax=Roseobacter sp. TaxID=1907202 RepID=UPI00385B69A0